MDALLRVGPFVLPLTVLPPSLWAGLMVLLFPTQLIVVFVPTRMIVVFVPTRLIVAIIPARLKDMILSTKKIAVILPPDQ
jgi:hypothetical protein